MKIDIKNITCENSEFENKDLWIAEVNTVLERPRIIKPQLARLTPKSEASKTIYYSSYFFRPYSDKGKLLKKDIAIFDNTGYRSYEGNPLSVFDNEADAKEWYNDRIQKIVDKRVESREYILKEFDEETQKYIDYLVD